MKAASTLRHWPVSSAALLGLYITVPLEAVLVIPTAVRIPTYILILPLVAAVAALSGLRDRTMVRSAVAVATVVWLAVSALSLLVWIFVPPPTVELAAQYGRLRASALRGPLQLAITLAYTAALPITLLLARRRLWWAVTCIAAIATAVATYGIYQVAAFRWGLPLRNLSNDPLTADRSIPSWRGLVRARSTFGEPAALGHFLIGVLPVVAAVAIWPPSRRARYLAAASAVILFACIVLTLAGAVWMALPVVAVGGVVAVLHRRAWRPGAAALVIAFIVPIVTLAPFLASTPPAAQTVQHTGSSGSGDGDGSGGQSSPPPELPTPETVGGHSGGSSVMAVPSTVIERVRESLGSGGTSDRVRIERYQVHLWKEHPVIGVGLGAADLYLAREFSPKSLPSTYGIWWGVLAETGLVGIVALLAVISLLIREIVSAARFSSRSRWYPVSVGCLIGVLAEFVSYLTFYERIAPHVWVLIGIGLLAARGGRGQIT